MKRNSNLSKGVLVVGLIIFSLLLNPTIWGSKALAAEETIVLKMAHQAFPPESFIPMTGNYWANLIKERTKGKVQVQIFYDTLAKGPEAFSATQEGIADVVEIPSSFISARVKDVAVFEWQGFYHAGRFPEMTAAIRSVMTKIFAEQGITYLGAMYTYAGLSTASIKHHYRTPDDMRGQKIRSAGMWNMKYFKIWGATPTMILPAEVYSSLQKGIIDGVSGILELIGTLKYYEVAPYITEYPDTEVTLITYGMNMKKFNSMEKQYQDVILQVSREAELYSFNSGRKYEAQIRKEIATKAKYLMLTPEEVRPFLEAVQPVKKEMREYCGPLGNELMDVLEKMRK